MLLKRYYKILAILIAIKLLIGLAYVLVNRSEPVVEFQYESREVLLVDNRNPPSEQEIFALIERELPALPFEHLRPDNNEQRRRDGCAPYPELFNIQFYADYWQKYENGNVSFLLYGAYYDKRAIVQSGAVVRLLVMINQIGEPFPPSYCQLWFEHRPEPSIVNVVDYFEIWEKAWGKPANFWYAHLLSCPLPPDFSGYVPQTVSLVAEPCARATNNLKVIYEEPKTNRTRKSFGVCVKGLDFPYVDVSARLVEWLELMRILGAEQVIVHDLQVHPNVSKVMKHYETEGFLQFIPITLAHNTPRLADFRHFFMERNSFDYMLNELIPYNDCFYRNMYKYDYLAVVDVDEVLMPLGNLSNWHELIAVAEQIRVGNCQSYASFCFLNVYYPRYPLSAGYSEEVPPYMYMLQHVQRVEKHLDKNLATKCLHSTKYVLTLHNHFPRYWQQSCSPESLNSSLAQLQHYREPDIKETLDHPVDDPNIWRFKAELVNRSVDVLRQLGFLAKVNVTKLSRG